MIGSSSLYKLMILYMLREADYPLTNTQILDFVLEKGYTDYFHLQETLSALVDNQMTETETVLNTTSYRITPEGLQTIASLEGDLSWEIRSDIKRYLQEHDYELRSDRAAVADYHQTPGQEYSVRCRIYEGHRAIFEVTLTVPTEEAARTLCGNWKDKSSRLYARVLQELGI